MTDIVLGSYAGKLFIYDLKYVLVLLFLLAGAATLYLQDYRKSTVAKGVILAFLVSAYLGISATGLHVKGLEDGSGILEEDQTMYIASGSDQVLLRFQARTPQAREYNLMLNGEKADEISTNRTKIWYNKELQLEQGTNTFKFTDQSCKTGETDCSRIFIENLALHPYHKGSYLGDGIVDTGDGFRIRNGAEIYIQKPGYYELKLENASSKAYNTTVSVPITENENISAKVIWDVTNTLTFPIKVQKEFETVKLGRDCENCPDIFMENISVEKYSRNLPLYVLFGENWHRPDATYRWNKGNSTIYIYNLEDRKVEKTVSITGRTVLDSARIEFVFNGETVRTESVGNQEKPREFDLDFEKGENTFEIKRDGGCVKISDHTEHKDDDRCTVFGLRKLEVR